MKIKMLMKRALCNMAVLVMLPIALLFSLTYKVVQGVSNHCYDPTLYVILAKMDIIDNYMVDITERIEQWAGLYEKQGGGDE